MSLNTTQIKKLIISKGKTISEEIETLNKNLNENIAVVSAVGRRSPDKHYVGSHVANLSKYICVSLIFSLNFI